MPQTYPNRATVEEQWETTIVKDGARVNMAATRYRLEDGAELMVYRFHNPFNSQTWIENTINGQTVSAFDALVRMGIYRGEKASV